MRAKYYFLICTYIAIFLNISIGHCFTISGTIDKEESNINSLQLYKFNTIFKREYIATIIVNDSKFEYSTINNEVDVYLIINSFNGQIIQFVWDGNIKIEIKSLDNFHKSQILNSPLSRELSNYYRSLTDSLITPVRRLDSLIGIEKTKCPNGCTFLDSLNIAKDKLAAFGHNTIDEYTLSYVKNNPDSFISLFVLTKYGIEQNRDDFRKHFMLLNDKLKQHSRAIAYHM